MYFLVEETFKYYAWGWSEVLKPGLLEMQLKFKI